MLECKLLTKSYGKILAVNGVSLQVEKQEIFGLRGIEAVIILKEG